MPLISLWKSNPTAVSELTIEQVVVTAGDGILRDNSPCAAEIREYFAQISSAKLGEYAAHCLSTVFPKGGHVLQDLVNELGRRLDYQVVNGRYQGTANAVGFDGLWLSPEGHAIVFESKTTDTFRVSLDTIVEYRNKLQASGEIKGTSSILIAVGRQDTGELEAQVRGSRHAWDIRLISVDALLKLVQLKENSESAETGVKMRALLTPMEYTRLDDLVDAMFTTAKDVEETTATLDSDVMPNEESINQPQSSEDNSKFHFTDAALIQTKREQIIEAVSLTSDTKLIKNSRALFWNSEHSVRLAATVSKRYDRSSSYRYWYAYHPQWDDFLSAGTRSYFALGGMDIPFAFVIPWEAIHGELPFLNTTITDTKTYWHIHISESAPGQYELLLPKKSTNLSLEKYRVNFR